MAALGGTFSTASGGDTIVHFDPNREAFEIHNLGSADAWLTTGEKAEANKGVYLPPGVSRYFTGIWAKQEWRGYSASSGVTYCAETVRPKNPGNPAARLAHYADNR